MNSPMQPIRGKVARVLNSREVAINRGLDDRVEVGMIFKVLSTKGSEITDPDTGERLGSVELEKTRVKVTDVQERIAVASTYRSYKVNVGGSGMALSRLFEPPRWERRFETLRVEDAAKEELDEEDAFVQTGDPVLQFIEVVKAEGGNQLLESSERRTA